MYHRLSNTLEREVIEKEAGIPFRYPNLYRTNPVINGLRESIVPVVTMNHIDEIRFAIWGLLPERFGEEWAVFQQAASTLTVGEEECQDGNTWYSGAFEKRRCLIFVSGFFTYFLYQGRIYPFFVHESTDRPLSLGGVYNQLEDGFVTCALIISHTDRLVAKAQNLDRGMPVVVAPFIRNEWLDPAARPAKLREHMRLASPPALRAYPVSKALFNPGAIPDSILEPFVYRELPERYQPR